LARGGSPLARRLVSFYMVGSNARYRRIWSSMNVPTGWDDSEAFHVFEQWIDDDCTLSRIVAEVIRGEHWNWKRQFIKASEAFRRDDPDWMSTSTMAGVISGFAEEARPAKAPQDWIETPSDKSTGREASILAREWTV